MIRTTAGRFERMSCDVYRLMDRILAGRTALKAWIHKEWRRDPSVIQTLTSSALASSQDDCFAVFSYQKRYKNVIGNARPVGVGISQSPCKQDALAEPIISRQISRRLCVEPYRITPDVRFWLKSCLKRGVLKARTAYRLTV